MPAPDLTQPVVTIGGTDRTVRIVPEESEIVQTLSRKGDTAHLILSDPTLTPNLVLPLQPVTVQDGKGHTLFSGLAVRPRCYTPLATENRWHLDCVDWTYFLTSTLG